MKRSTQGFIDKRDSSARAFILAFLVREPRLDELTTSLITYVIRFISLFLVSLARVRESEENGRDIERLSRQMAIRATIFPV